MKNLLCMLGIHKWKKFHTMSLYKECYGKKCETCGKIDKKSYEEYDLYFTL